MNTVLTATSVVDFLPSGETMNEYPPECPLFMVVDAFGRYLLTGAIVEGVDPCIRGQDFDGIGARVLDDSELVKKPAMSPDGWYGVVFNHCALRPLTPAAEEMLAIAREQS